MLHLSLLLLLSLYFTYVSSQSIRQVSHRLTLVKRQHQHHHRSSTLSRLGLTAPNELYGYFTNVTVGSDKIKMFIDTGSFRFVVNHAKYHPEKSSTSVNLHTGTDSLYGGGGGGDIDLYRDDVAIGGLLVKGPLIGRFLKLAHGQPEPAPDILGLSAPYGPKEKDPSVLVPMAAQHLLPTASFTLDLEPHAGSLVFNDPDITKDFVYHHINDTLYPGTWMIPSKAFGLQRDMVLDSGTGLNYLSKSDIVVFAKYFNLEIIDGGGVATRFQPVGPCDRDVGLVFEFSQGQKVHIPKHLFWRPIPGKKDQCYSNFVASEDDFVEDGFWIFGMAFLQAVKVSHDIKGGRVGL